MGVYSPRAVDGVDEARVIAEGFARPLGAPRLRDAARGHKRVLVLVDDATRKTPTARFLPQVMAELAAAGVADERIEFLAAPGTHRELTEEEWKLKLGGL